jgi:peptidyl-prolyl cis-trans isomerase A (cyclophilin A)
MIRIWTILLCLCSLLSCSEKKSGANTIVIDTEYGEITVALDPEKAPKTVAAFLKNVDAGIYANGSFYRVLKQEDLPKEYNQGLIQGGVFQSKPGLATAMIEHESPKQTGLSHLSGTISMARTKPGTASSEFFICVGDQPQFDSSSRGQSDGLGYAAFGKVTTGMEVVRDIQAAKSEGESFNSPIKIKSIKRD